MANINPRHPKKNRELKSIEKLMVRKWREFRNADNHREKVGNAMLLQAHLEAWLDEPEFITDLMDGAVEGAKRMDDDPENAQYPWDKAGESEDAIFCLGYGGPSRLYTKEQWRAEPYITMKYGNFVVPVYEKVYSTDQETVAHFISEQAFARHVNITQKGMRGYEGYYDVLSDPAGCDQMNGSFRVYASSSMKRAIKKADILAEKYGIRFVVAKLLGLVDNH